MKVSSNQVMKAHESMFRFGTYGTPVRTKRKYERKKLKGNDGTPTGSEEVGEPSSGSVKKAKKPGEPDGIIQPRPPVVAGYDSDNDIGI